MDKQMSRKPRTSGLGENSSNLCEAGISSCSTCFISGDCVRQKSGAVGASEKEGKPDAQAILDAESGEISVYRTIATISSGDLYSREQIENLLCSFGSLDEVCSRYAERFGNQLVWMYPISDNTQGGGAIVPVQEGLLFIPHSDQQLGYNMSGIELLDANAVRTMKTESKAYFDGLFSALSDMEALLQNGGVNFDR